MKSNLLYKCVLIDIINVFFFGWCSLSCVIYYYKSLIINIVCGCVYYRMI